MVFGHGGDLRNIMLDISVSQSDNNSIFAGLSLSEVRRAIQASRLSERAARKRRVAPSVALRRLRRSLRLRFLRRSPHTVAEFQGGLVKISRPSPVNGHARKNRGATRGKIKGFSFKSRKRLLEKFARLDYSSSHSTVMVTLTYPAEFPDNQTAKKHLRAFLERVRRNFPGVSGVWKLEFQKRGAPHYHIIFFGLPFLPHSVVNRWWAEVLQHMGYIRTEIKAVNGRKQAMNYVSKYVAKVQGVSVVGGGNLDNLDQEDSSLVTVPYLHADTGEFLDAYWVGRFWGIFNGAFLPFASRSVVKFRGRQRVFYDFRRAAGRYYRRLHKGGKFQGFTLFCNDASQWETLFFRLGLDGFPG